jgi:hypothetical protein
MTHRNAKAGWRAHTSAGRQVGDVAEFQPVTETPILGLRHLPGERHLELAKVATERKLLVVGQLLVAEHQHRVLVHSRLDRSHLVPAQRTRNVDAQDFAHEDRMNRADADAHSVPLQCTSAGL